MLFRLLAIALLLGAAVYAAPSVVSAVAEYKVRSGLIEAGVSERTARCMAKRMVKRLTITQLRKLERAQGTKNSLGGYMSAVRKIGDGEVVAVTVTSSLLCRTGLANESKRESKPESKR